MVRRWSCLIELNNNFDNFNYFSKNHKINLFKSSVNYKRFTFKFTKFKRKSLIRLKHRSNWLIYTNVIKFWVKDYMFNKHYLRYQFYNKIFINNFYFYNFNFIKNRNENYFYNFNFIFSTFTNTKYSYFFGKNIILKNSPTTVAWFLNTPVFNNSVIPIYNTWNDIFYNFESNKSSDNILEDIFDTFFSIFLKKNVEVRKILILLYYKNIINFKKLNNFVFGFI